MRGGEREGKGERGRERRGRERGEVEVEGGRDKLERSRFQCCHTR